MGWQFCLDSPLIISTCYSDFIQTTSAAIIHQESMYMVHLILMFRKKSILLPLFNAELGKLRQAGLIHFLYSNYVDVRRIKSKQRTSSNLQLGTIFVVLRRSVFCQLCCVNFGSAQREICSNQVYSWFLHLLAIELIW